MPTILFRIPMVLDKMGPILSKTECHRKTKQGYNWNTEQVWYSIPHWIIWLSRPFEFWSEFDHLNAILVRYSSLYLIFLYFPDCTTQRLFIWSFRGLFTPLGTWGWSQCSRLLELHPSSRSCHQGKNWRVCYAVAGKHLTLICLYVCLPNF